MRTRETLASRAAPVTDERTLDKSNDPRSGWLMIVWNTVGGPGSMVMRSLPTRSSIDQERHTSTTRCTSWGRARYPATAGAGGTSDTVSFRSG